MELSRAAAGAALDASVIEIPIRAAPPDASGAGLESALDSGMPPPATAPTTTCTGYSSQYDAALSPGFETGNGSQTCDLPDRVILVDKQVTVIYRPTMKRKTARIARTEHLANRCDGAAGGHAGCSRTFDRYWSAALGRGSYLEFSRDDGNSLANDQLTEAYCREDYSYGVLATCSTKKWFLMIRAVEDPKAATACWHRVGRLWQGADETGIDLAGDVDRVASTGHRWVYRFPATAGGPAVALTFDGHKRVATLEVDGNRETCVAFRP